MWVWFDTRPRRAGGGSHPGSVTACWADLLGAGTTMAFLDGLLPERLGRPFRWLFASATLSNLGDGVLLAAGPLVVTEVTRSPIAVTASLAAQRLPWVLFGLQAGALVDRWDRRRVLVAANVARAAVLAGLATAIALGQLSLPLVYGALFLLGTAETFADNASSAMVATTVPDAHLGLANARMVGTHLVANQLAGPPVGALLFSLGMATPFAAEAALVALAAVTAARVHVDRPAGGDEARRRGRMRADVVEGLRWLRATPPVWRLTVLIGLFNVTFGATYAILVLYATELLGLTDVGFGLLLTASAVGGVVGSGLFERLEHRFSYAQLLRAGLLVETATHGLLAVVREPLLAGLVLTAFGVHAAVWGSLSTTIRLRATPEPLLGRVTSVYLLFVFAPLPVGALLGGWIGDVFGIAAVFAFGFVGAGLTVAWVWRSIADIGAIARRDLDDGDGPA